jgi:drug/metabolite transporter (DMT)-like permease
MSIKGDSQVALACCEVIMFGQYIGEFSAIGTALSFAFGSILFTFSGRAIGSTLVNRARLVVAVIFIIALHWAMLGEPFPQGVTQEQWFWLGLSGFIGFALGDAFLFQAFVMIGPRISMLIMALAPVLASLMAWLFLGESLVSRDLIGIVVTVSGIAVVVSERTGKSKHDDIEHKPGYYLLGLLFAFGGAAGQAGGLILSKIGLANDFPALSGNLIRLIVATLLIWLFSAFRGEIVSSYRTLKDNPRAMWMLSIAAVAGPAIGVWLSLIAIQRAPVGVASTLMSLTPVFLIPIGYFLFKERISRQAILGTLLAFAGTALLFL